MMGKHVRSGMIFGQLTVLEVVPGKTLGKPKARCLCTCGRMHITSTTQLIHRKAHRCKGCAVFKLPAGEAVFRRKFDGYTRAAKYRGREFSLTRDQFRVLHDASCTYCGLLPSKGADRKDNDIGYILENCVPCCKPCNYAKRAMSEQDFLNWIARIAAFQGFSL